MAAILIKYFLGTIDKSTINDQIEISENEYAFCFNVLKDFSELIQNEYLFKVVDLNYEDFKSKINYYANEVIQAHHTELNTIFIDINRLSLNVLSAMRTFLDHKETGLKRKFSAVSEEVALFEKEKKEAFDNNFEYRFISKLRNYAQHCGLPIEPPEVKSFQSESFEVKNEFNVFFDRNKLLSTFDWGLIVKKDLEVQPEKITVLPMFTKVHELLDLINKKINDRILKNYKNEGQILLSLIRRTVGLIGMPCLMKSECVEGSEIITYSVNMFPLEHISKITGITINFNYVDQLSP